MIFEDESLLDMELTLSEIKLREAHTIVFTDCYSKLTAKKIDDFIEIPHISFFSTLLALIPFHIIINEICKLKNLNPDDHSFIKT